MKNTIHLEGLILRSVSQTVELKNGKVKRELELDYGKQRYIVDQIVASPRDFTHLDTHILYDVILYLNGILKDGIRYNKLSLKKIKLHGEIKTPYIHEKVNHDYPVHIANDVPANGGISTTVPRPISKLIRATFNW
jgi:hypothetical protein